jgi:D-alanine-D-alanine ligase and related ATP-grasp enzymes
MSKLKLAVIYGGQSTEHDISIKSATSIVNALDRSKYEISLIKIDKDGTWNTMSGDAINTAEKNCPNNPCKGKRSNQNLQFNY